MKISQLKQIIREEIKHSLNEKDIEDFLSRKDLKSALQKLLKGGNTPDYDKASELCDSMAALYGGDNNHFFKKGHEDIKRMWSICNLLAGSGEDGLFAELLTVKMSLRMVILKTIKAIDKVPKTEWERSNED